MFIPDISDDRLNQLPLHDSNGKILYNIEEKPLGDDITIIASDKSINISNPKCDLTKYKKSIELLFEYVMEKHNASKLTLHAVHNSDIHIYNISIENDDNTSTFSTSDRDDLLDTFFLNKIPILYQNNLNNCIRFAKSHTMEENIDSLILRSTTNNDHILRIPNKNITTINEKLNSQLEYLTRISSNYFNINRLSILSNKFGKITPKSRNNFINLLLNDVNTTISNDIKFTNIFNQLSKPNQDLITSKYQLYATNLVDLYLKNK